MCDLLKKAGFKVWVYSSKKNIFLRLISMCWGVLKNDNANYILIDTYSTFNFYYALVVSQIARLLAIPYIPILHGGNLPNRLKKTPKLAAMVFKNADVNIAPSKYLLNEFQQKGFKTQFIPNAIQINNYPFTTRAVLRPKLLWVRAFDKIYNPQLAVLVLAKLKLRFPNACLCMIGPDKDGSLEDVKKLAKDLNLEDALVFTGYLSKENWIAKAAEFDLFINTTNIDNTPVSIVEAMALGLPVVSTNVGGIPYLIEDTVNGLLVEKDDADQMVKQLISLLEAPIKALEMSQNARKMVENFDVAIVQQQWEQILK
ncbi:glycosyltransferase family 1 protein [Lutibacter sp. HS1-25]|nr:glycosyltransferase family 1 protein [Lutibacter sp. HS1-25]